MLNIFKSTVCIAAVIFSTQTFASTVAVIDSGTDYLHLDLKDHMWLNPSETKDGSDNDGNGKVDDINGWNFAENNEKIIDYSYLGTFSDDVYKYFEIQLKAFKGTITTDERAWIQQKRQDMEFIKELQKFGNFVHGTHVSGIVAKDGMNTKIMGIKLIPTEVKLPGAGIMSESVSSEVIPTDDPPSTISPILDMLLKKGIDTLASQQGKTLDQIGLYIWNEGANAANGSFGTSTEAVKPLLAQLLATLLKREASEEELDFYTKYFVNSLVINARAFTVTANKTFFVFAAGNDGKNNDEFPVFPANIKRTNTISVAATYGYSKIASFSNFGTENVEVAAPGVGILSSIPGTDAHMRVSGTSQAAPYVTNIVARMMDTNSSLTFDQIKKILMGTVDYKDFLTDKVTSGGIVNAERAIYAAKMMLKQSSVYAAISQSRIDIADVKEGDYLPIDEFGNAMDDRALLIDMPNLFKL